MVLHVRQPRKPKKSQCGMHQKSLGQSNIESWTKAPSDINPAGKAPLGKKPAGHYPPAQKNEVNIYLEYKCSGDRTEIVRVRRLQPKISRSR